MQESIVNENAVRRGKKKNNIKFQNLYNQLI